MAKQKDLLKDLISKPQREVAGASTAARFDFQKCWALCEMIDRHCSGQDYVVAFEFHDDVLFFDAETNPNEVEFCQVKTSQSAKPRQLSSITSRRKPRNSIIGKMLKNVEGLADYPSAKLVLVSNTVFEFSDTIICAKDLEEKYRAKLVEKITDELPTLNEDILDRIHFQVVQIPVEQVETYLRGKAVDLFESRFGSDFTEAVLPWLRAVIGEANRRNNFPPDSVSDVPTLIEKKCIGRSFVETSLDVVEARHRPAPQIGNLVGKLLMEGWDAKVTTRIEKQMATAAADFTDPQNAECEKLCDAIREVLTYGPDSADGLGTVLTSAYQTLESSGAIPSPYNEQGYMYALILLVFHESV
ncbi:MAG: dsDNA nuclease domain-containing protein [Planctomycetota bacterium]